MRISFASVVLQQHRATVETPQIIVRSTTMEECTKPKHEKSNPQKRIVAGPRVPAASRRSSSLETSLLPTNRTTTVFSVIEVNVLTPSCPPLTSHSTLLQ
ncbi:hypothetical protein WUBG_18882 [Wuchereria bancrofti]|uniref:Uncharacterized protein n=1 Tax=Wuchereria bancrofti TaxID=6293 RepID=J9DZZ7_WUCBA|nr:hypothetical protein WUBG_18882 [Wuchereria bancrofti]